MDHFSEILLDIVIDKLFTALIFTEMIAPNSYNRNSQLSSTLTNMLVQ